MVQVENETGSYGTPRDYSPEGNRLFAGPVPTELVKALGKTPGTWSAVFGPIAEQAFNSWYTARYVDAIAAAGKARSEEHTSELQSLMRISYAVFCLKKKKKTHT